MALEPTLFVRFDGTSEFTRAPKLPTGTYNLRGPMVDWAQTTADVALTIPAGADRIEAFIRWGRISWKGATCYLAYDMMECPDTFPLDDAYLSNYGANFILHVER